MTVDKKLDAIDTTASTTDRVSLNSFFRYDRSEEGWQQVLADRQELYAQDLSLDADTYDNWRHNRIRAPLKAIVESDPNASWLTVGDGRYGTDAHFLLKAGAKDVHCSDISDAPLRVSSEAGFIDRYSSENAENISFNDNTFDFVYCKEAFHHFRAPIWHFTRCFDLQKGSHTFGTKGYCYRHRADSKIQKRA